jgi:hypothetical protein
VPASERCPKKSVILSLASVATGAWKEAHEQREALMARILEWSGVGTLEDMRRFRDYDADHLVDKFLNQPAVKVQDSCTHPIHPFMFC